MAQPTLVGKTLPEELMADANGDVPPPHSPPPPSVTQPLPYSQPTLFAQPSQPQNIYAYTSYVTQQASCPSSQPQMVPTQPFLHTSFPSSQQQIVHPPSAPNTPLPPVQPPMTPQIMSNLISRNGLNLQNPDIATIMTIMEVVRHMDHSSWFGQNQLPISQPPANPSGSAFFVQPSGTPGSTPSTSTFRATRVTESPGVDVSLSSSQEHHGATSSREHEPATEVFEDRPRKRKSRTKLARSPDKMSTPSTSRKRPPVVKPTNPPPKRLRKGKEKAILTDPSEHSEVDELKEDSDDSYPPHSSVSPSAQPRNIVARKMHGEIFLSGSGQPLRFFVQVDLHGRHAVVTNIKVYLKSIFHFKLDADCFIEKQGKNREQHCRCRLLDLVLSL